uniref:NIM1-interacting protein n=1 Tax=Cannabis sativa TaxID=3483 RepID=A0A803NPX9_CANSA
MDSEELRSLMESRNNNNNNSIKRRRSFYEEEEEEGDDEEEKINKFYSLIKSIREARNDLINMKKKASSSSTSSSDNKEKIMKKPATVWNPSFQIEDFMEEDHHHRRPRILHHNRLTIKTPLDFMPTAAPSSSSTTNLDASNYRELQKKEMIITKDHQGLDLTLSL